MRQLSSDNNWIQILIINMQFLYNLESNDPYTSQIQGVTNEIKPLILCASSIRLFIK